MKYKISDIAKVVNGSTPSTSDASNYDGDIVWITPKDLSEQKSKYIERGSRNITSDGYASCSTQMIPAYNLLMSSRAPIGLFAINTVDCCTNQGFKNMILNKEKVDVDFIYYFLKFHICEIEALGSGTTFKEVSKSALEKYEIDIPSLDEQRKIAKVLSNLDEKIALNRAMNEELEQTARDLYDYWFLQFDFPDANGKPYRSSGGKMVYNDILKREIPQGWEVGNLYKIANFTNGLACQKFRPKDGEKKLPVIKIGEMHNGISDATEFVKFDIPENVKVYDGDLLFSWSASLEVMLWANGSGGLNQHIFKVTGNNGFPKSFVLYELKDYVKVFKKIAESRKTTMGHITSEHLKQSAVCLPPTLDAPNAFEAKVSPLLEQIVANTQELIHLTSLRDELLPLLMNGQVEVKE